MVGLAGQLSLVVSERCTAVSQQDLADGVPEEQGEIKP